MTIIHWNQSMEVGHPMIDADHKILVDRVNTLAAPFLSPELVLPAFDDLVAHAVAHFGREEALMRAIAYLDLPRHRKEHLHMLDDLADQRRELVSGATTANEVGRFVRQWFMTHALFSDQRLVDVFAQKTKERQSA